MFLSHLQSQQKGMELKKFHIVQCWTKMTWPLYYMPHWLLHVGFPLGEYLWVRQLSGDEGNPWGKEEGTGM